MTDMIPSGPESSQLEQLWKGAVAAVGIAAVWVWNNTMGRISALEQGKLDKTEFKESMARAETSRTELHAAQIRLEDGQKGMSNSLARIEGALSERAKK